MVLSTWFNFTGLPLWGLSSIGVLLVISCWLLLRDRNRMKLHQHVRELEDEHILDAERQRIARDVHDDLGADLSNLLLLARMGLRHVPAGTSGHEELRRIETLSSEMLEKIDEIIWSLDPRGDRWDASIAFIDRYAGEMASQHGLEFRTNTQGVTSPVTLHPPKRRDLYLVAKEILQNIAEHAGARTVNLVAHTVHGQLVLRISDDGEGSNASTAGSGHGQENIRKRIEKWEGSVRIEHMEPRGTTVVIAMPLDEHHPKG